MDAAIDRILQYWFGHVEQTIIPSEHRTRVWFSESSEIDDEIKLQFTEDLNKAKRGDYAAWEETPRGQLALIIIFDQFSRHIYRGTPGAFAQDKEALRICLKGSAVEAEHALSLIERVFYYFPLLHSEAIPHQQSCLRAYDILMQLAFPETQIIYESFYKFANYHYEIIRKYGRFPQRNVVLGRVSTPEELLFLKNLDEQEKG